MTDYEGHYLQLRKYINNLVLFNEEQMSLVLSFFKPLLLKRNEVLVQAGDYRRYMNFVAKAVSVFILSGMNGRIRRVT